MTGKQKAWDELNSALDDMKDRQELMPVFEKTHANLNLSKDEDYSCKYKDKTTQKSFEDFYDGYNEGYAQRAKEE